MQTTEPSIVMRPLAELIPYARNARVHSEPQIAASIGEFGFINPIVTDGENGTRRLKLVREPGPDRR